MARNRLTFTEEQKAEAVRLYTEELHSTIKVAEFLGCSIPSAVTLLRSMEVTLRPKGRVKGKKLGTKGRAVTIPKEVPEVKPYIESVPDLEEEAPVTNLEKTIEETRNRILNSARERGGFITNG